MLRHEPATLRLDRARDLAGQAGAASDAANENRVCPSIAFLAGDAYPRIFLSRATRQAIRHGTSGASELLAHGLITETAYYRSLAEHAGVDFVDPGRIAEAFPDDARDSRQALFRRGAWCRLADGGVRALFAPPPGGSGIGTPRFRERLKDMPGVAITTPTGLRTALARGSRRALGRVASEGLATDMPQSSAKYGAAAWHGFMVAAALTAMAAGLVMAPAIALLVLHGSVTLFFLATVMLRTLAAIGYRRKTNRPLPHFPNTDRPVYSVVVALYREAPVVADLVRSLKELHWPRSKLEIKLVCEEGDDETLAALARERLDRRFEVVVVPAMEPRTKPKALNYALPFCSGSFVTLYDAEDRPHPDQLEEAWQVFRQEDTRLGALQAPLVIANPRRNWLTTQFHLEFAALFHGILPWLARNGLPVPLGGTSTHFRRAAVEAAGGWDPHNVTEDADLGFRMWRAGYKIGTISRPTLEDAPDTVGVWLPQRTRWLKGWIQTWLVHTRRRARRPDEKPYTGAAAMHVMLAGTVVCALFFPFTILTVAAVGAWSMATGSVPVVWTVLAVLDWTNIALAFAAQAVLILRTVDRDMRRRALATLPEMPFYWLLGSYAGWRAVRQYFASPFLWEKTPHGPHDPNGVRHT